MADSAGIGAGKRERLVRGAQGLLHRRGLRTSLAEVAHAADVPPGNVYYYFKTKDELVDAVLEAYAEGVREMLARFDRLRTPQARLKALARHWVEMRDEVAAHGCPIGSLTSELGKTEEPFDGAMPLALVLDWAEREFRELGASGPRDHAIALVAGIQGAAMLANAFRDPSFLTREARQLDRWIDALS